MVIRIMILALMAFFGVFQTCGLTREDKPICCKKPKKESDLEFKPYVNSFESYGKINAQKTPIYFANLSGATAGICHYFRIGDGPVRWGYIEIDEKYWGIMSNYQKTNLIFHELGHCILGLDHVQWKNYVTQCPTSFMYNTVLTTQCIEDNYDAYIKEMFPQWEK